MRTKQIVVLLCVLFIGIASNVYSQKKAKDPSKVSAGILTGYNRGYGIQGNIALNRSASELPFDLRVGVGYTFLNPGNALDARRIFINNNTNGSPEKSGRSIDYRLDFMIPKPILGISNSYIVLGPRGSSFKGNFQYIGGNEDFDVISHQWGLGGGIESHFNMAKNFNFVIAVGLDYYLPSTLHGHDTSYSPDNDNVNTRNDTENNDTPFTYKDANEAIAQPAFMPYAMIGVTLDL
jgi:hypothetical protein